MAQRANSTKSPGASLSTKPCCKASHQASASLSSVPSLQRNAGNRALSRFLQAKKIQAKLVVGPSDDAYEREADRVADTLDKPRQNAALSSVSHNTLQRKCAECEAGEQTRPPEVVPKEEAAGGDLSERIQTKSQGTSGHETRRLESALKAVSQGGSPLEPNLRARMEQRMGADFSAVRVHTNAAAAQMNNELNARAFTHGSDIYFGEGKYDPASPSGQRLLAHELVHVVQQGGGAQSRLIQRDGDKNKKPAAGRAMKSFQVLVPKDYTTLDQMFRLFERVAYRREVNHEWRCNAYCDMSKNAGKVITFHVPKDEVDQLTDPDYKKAQEKTKDTFEKLTGPGKNAIKNEADKRFYQQSGDKRGKPIKKGEEGKAQMWEDQLHEVIKEKETLESLPPEVKSLLGPEAAYKPSDYQRLLKIAEKLKQFTSEDLAVYKLLTVRATSNIDLFEKSVDMFLARKEELKKALAEEQAKTASGGKKDTLKDAFDEKWKDMDESSIGKMSESDRYDLARQKTAEMTAAQLKYMKDHPGATLKDFAKSATLMNTGETASAVWKDMKEAADGDANSWARWAAGTGAGAKVSGWLLAVAGVLYVASWLTGVGALATIAAAAAVLLGTTLTLSAAESELRIKAASQAKTPEEFKRNVELAAAARANFIVGVALLVIALVLHFTAKALFPQTVKRIGVSLKNFRERIRLKGSIYEIKPQIKTDMTAYKAELVKGAETAKQNALTSAGELEKLSTEQFVDKIESGDTGFMDQSKLPPEQKVNYRDLLKSPEGRAAIEAYKAQLINSLKTDVVQAIDKLAQEYVSKIDEFMKEAEAAKNHDELKGATDKFEGATSEESMKKFLAGEQEKLKQQKLEEAAKEAHQEVITSIKDAMLKRLKERFGKQADKFRLDYTDAEINEIVKKGKELGLSDKLIEDLIYTGSRIDKAISAADLMKQMENWTSEVSKRGFPYKFTDMAQFEAFSADLIKGVREAKLPTNDVRIQGSALRKPGADDVDIAVFVEESAFDKLLVDRYNERAALADGTKIDLAGKSHNELVKLGQDIEANPKNYNGQARTFMNAIKTGIINSKSDIIPALKAVKNFMAGKYPNLNIQTVSVLIKEGLFDVKPDLPVKSK